MKTPHIIVYDTGPLGTIKIQYKLGNPFTLFSMYARGILHWDSVINIVGVGLVRVTHIDINSRKKNIESIYCYKIG